VHWSAWPASAAGSVSRPPPFRQRARGAAASSTASAGPTVTWANSPCLNFHPLSAPAKRTLNPHRLPSHLYGSKGYSTGRKARKSTVMRRKEGKCQREVRAGPIGPEEGYFTLSTAAQFGALVGC